MTYAKVWQRVRKDGRNLSLLFGAFTSMTLLLNPEIWLNDYPPDIKEKFGPQSEKARRQGWLVAIPFFLLLIGPVVRSNLALKKENGGVLPFKMAFLNTYGQFVYVWLFDLVIMDWLLFVTVQPKRIVLPGTEGAAGYKDYGFHLKAALPALPIMILPSLLIAALTYGRSPQNHLLSETSS
ncbi:MAG: hypothetical protein H6657_00995 [Ardenticatenaceae bacterium]|nr:hypothetical protein [Anaerolineales bacterium]MCB8975988.1 hypothetical protein [Ardenticatenaceae bacterium]